MTSEIDQLKEKYLKKNKIPRRKQLKGNLQSEVNKILTIKEKLKDKEVSVSELQRLRKETLELLTILETNIDYPDF
jgi:hypothetical protein